MSLRKIAGFILRNSLLQTPQRRFCVLPVQNESASGEYEEIRIPVQWGHIAGKYYGPKDVRPIVGLHGWQDNAGTFDTLAPLLPPHVSFLSLDLPGHGLSSRLPDGLSYHSIDYVHLVLTLMEEKGWEKISLMGHSMSSVNNFIFSTLFPDKVDMCIGLDVLKPLNKTPKQLVEALNERISNFHIVDKRNREKSEPPSYTYDDLVERMYNGTFKSVSKESCQYLLKRNISKSAKNPEKYFFSRDSRLKTSYFFIIPHETVLEMIQRLTCPYLFIKATNAPYYENKKYYDEALASLKLRPNFVSHEVEGTHHVHLNEPKKISEIINPFILKHRPT